MNRWSSAESDGVVASSTSWMQGIPDHYNKSEWLLSPSSFVSNDAMLWGATHLYRDMTSQSIGVRPVLYLKSETIAIDGLGTEESPFEVVIE